MLGSNNKYCPHCGATIFKKRTICWLCEKSVWLGEQPPPLKTKDVNILENSTEPIEWARQSSVEDGFRDGLTSLAWMEWSGFLVRLALLIFIFGGFSYYPASMRWFFSLVLSVLFFLRLRGPRTESVGFFHSVVVNLFTSTMLFFVILFLIFIAFLDLIQLDLIQRFVRF